MVPEPDGAAVAAYWAEFCAATGTTGEPADVFGFGDSERMADELLALVLAGTKQATAGALADYRLEGLDPPGVGDRTRAGWVAGHQAFFRRWFAASGRKPDEDPELVFERFRRVWPR